MVTSVSGVTQQNNQPIRAMDKITPEQLAHPGYYVVSPVKGLYEVPEPSYKKKGGFLKFLGKVILTAVVVGGAAMGIRKRFMGGYQVKPVAEKGERFKNWFCKQADWLYNHSIGLLKKSDPKANANDSKAGGVKNDSANTQGANTTSTEQK